MQAVVFSAERSLLGQGKKGADMSTSGGYIKSLAKPRSALRFFARTYKGCPRHLTPKDALVVVGLREQDRAQ